MTASPVRIPINRSDAIAQALEGISAGEIVDFAQLRALGDQWPDPLFRLAAYEVGFPLIKRLHWGYFAALDPRRYPRLWSELVIPDRDWDFAGALKRSISLPNLYVGLIDLHGYTRFCRDNRHNLSRLSQLDAIIQREVPKVTEKAGVLARRVRGDEILLVGASAADVLEAVLLVGDFFKADDGARARNNVFPRFEIAAGVAGGQGFTALVVTEDGDISGDAVNTAARLQSRAGRISPDRTRVMVTVHVQRRLQAELSDPENRSNYPLLGRVEFVDAGRVEFKGLAVEVHDAVFLDGEDARRINHKDALRSLYESLDSGLWKGRVFEDAVNLAAALGAGGAEVLALEARNRSRTAQASFAQESYEDAVEMLESLVALLADEPGADVLALEYLRGVCACYRRILSSYAEVLDREVESSLASLFGEKDLSNYRMLQTHHTAFVRVREATRKKVRNRKVLWYRVADAEAPELKVKVGEPK